MKAHVITLLVIDHDKIGAAEAVQTIECARYPNRCIRPHVLSAKTAEIGEWGDDHPLNRQGTDVLAWLGIGPHPDMAAWEVSDG